MAQKKITITICDRCGSEERTDSPAKAFIQPGDGRKRGKTWELCTPCTQALEEFLSLHMEQG